MKKPILIAIAVLIAGTAFADDQVFRSGPTIGPLAELTPAERAKFREHWNSLPPEQRAAIRNKLREEWQGLPPEQRQQTGQQLLEQMHYRQAGPGAPSPGQGGWSGGDRGYGQGYGTRP
ncbi:MAG TPA: DUF3106 domain-containing protein [Parasulfuritortus sp.]